MSQTKRDDSRMRRTDRDSSRKKPVKRNQTATTNIGAGSQWAMVNQQIETHSNQESNLNEIASSANR